jgi:hypothetical protein
VLKSEGVFSFGEVEHGSKVHAFLDEFVNANTATGHVGAYVDSRLEHWMVDAGFCEVESRLISCPWVFQSRESMINFISGLFNLKSLNQDFLFEQLNKFLGVKQKNGQFFLDWELRYFRGVKN